MFLIGIHFKKIQNIVLKLLSSDSNSLCKGVI